MVSTTINFTSSVESFTHNTGIIMHNIMEKKIQSALNFGPNQITLKNIQSAFNLVPTQSTMQNYLKVY